MCVNIPMIRDEVFFILLLRGFYLHSILFYDRENVTQVDFFLSHLLRNDRKSIIIKQYDVTAITKIDCQLINIRYISFVIFFI